MDVDDAEDDEGDVYDKWKNVLLRNSIANSSLVKVKKIKASTFFSKGRLNELGEFIKKNKVNALFVNTVLSPVQQRNLQMYFFYIK
jgi:50S ribosomal subunit-associated GTPase HflX